MTHKHDVFLSYSSVDRKWADSVAKALVERGLQVWYAEQELQSGEVIAEKIGEALRDSRLVAILLTRAGATSPNVFFELGAAIALEKKVVLIPSKDDPIRMLPAPVRAQAKKMAFLAVEEPHSVAEQILAELGDLMTKPGIDWSEADAAIEYVDNLAITGCRRTKELFDRGMECKERGLYLDGAAAFQKALNTGVSGPEKIALLILLGTTHMRMGRLNEAISLYEGAIREAEGIQDRFGLLAACGNLGIASALKGKLMEAQQHCKKAILLCEQMGFAKGKANLLANLANVSERLGNQKAASKYYREAIAVTEAIEGRKAPVRQDVNCLAELAVKTGREMGLSEAELNAIRQAAFLHDVGLIIIPQRVLLKRGKLTESEFEMMKSHASIGARIVGEFREFAEAVPIVRSHHERWDGRGYPEGLRGDNIPIGAQVIALVDAYTALTADRPYRVALTPNEALRELHSGSGSQWNPEVVEAFFRVVSPGQESGVYTST